MKSGSTIVCLILTLLHLPMYTGNLLKKVNPLLGNVHVVGGMGWPVAILIQGATYPFGMVKLHRLSFNLKRVLLQANCLEQDAATWGISTLASSKSEAEHLTPYRPGLNGIPEYIEGKSRICALCPF